MDYFVTITTAAVSAPVSAAMNDLVPEIASLLNAYHHQKAFE
jgi:hypothetical protein